VNQLENKYAIKRISKSTDDGYVESLKIYSDSTPVDIKTNTNEITYWIDNQKEASTFELLSFILYLDDKIIGFAMLCYLTNRRVIVYDYIAIKDPFRVNTAFFSYVSLIKNYISSNSYEVDYFVVEINNKNSGKDQDKESRLFLKFLCLEGFGVVNAKYRTLPLGVDNHESCFDAFLYIRKSGDITSSISRNTFLNIVKGIYFDYYEKWYSVSLKADMDNYRKSVNQCFKDIEDDTDTVSILNITSNECRILSDLKYDRTDGSLPARKKHIYKILFLVIPILIIAPILIVFGYNWTLNKLGIEISSVNSMIGSVFGATATFFTAFFITQKRKS